MQSFNIRSVEKSYSQKTPSPKDLSNETLLRNTHTLVAEERKLTTEVLWYLHEIQVRRLYAEKGYSSLFEFAVKELAYSPAAAGRRIAAMRLLADIPEIEPALQKGDVTLSTLSTVQSFIQRKDSAVSRQEKKELVLALQGKSRRECEKVLIKLDPVAALPKDRERVVSPTQTEIRFVADDELMEKFQKIKELDGHVLSNPSYLEFFHRVADIALQKLDRASNNSNSLKVGGPTPPAELKASANPRYIPAALKREVWRRDRSQCTYQSSDGRKCASRFALEIDHVEPLAMGGKTEISNLRLLCRAHNQQQAVFKLGPQQMNFFLHQ
jgi:5-methylcytosine-specific restriction endonuclease McrA